MHADSVDTMIKRLETPPIELSPTLVNILDCVAIMGHAVVNKKETRRLREVVEVVNVRGDGSALINTPFVWNAEQDTFYFKKDSKVLEKISARSGTPVNELQDEFVKRTKLLYTLYQRKIFGFDEMRKIINAYGKNPEFVLKQYGIS
jgi:flagellar protein FlaI